MCVEFVRYIPSMALVPDIKAIGKTGANGADGGRKQNKSFISKHWLHYGSCVSRQTMLKQNTVTALYLLVRKEAATAKTQYKAEWDVTREWKQVTVVSVAKMNEQRKAHFFLIIWIKTSFL